MLLKGFKFYFLTVCLCLILLYVVMFPFIWAYEDGTNNSQLAVFCDKVFDKVFFSYNFWIRTKTANYALVLSFLVSSLSITTMVTLIVNLIKRNKK